MARRTGESRLTGRGARRLAGAVSLLLAACLIAGSLTLAIHASNPPPMPHQFYGTVAYDGAPVAEDTLVEAFVGGVKEAQTTVDAEGLYGYDPAFTVPGTAGAEVTFEVGGVPANESSTWQSGRVQELNLTVDEEPEPPVPKYTLTMAAVPEAGGNATDETGTSPYLEGAQVAIKAQAQEGYRFVNWTSAPVGIIDDEEDAETFLTMPAQDVIVTASFAEAYELTMAVDPADGGTAIDVTDDAPYIEGAGVQIRGQANPGYRFTGWTASAGHLADAEASITTFTMPGEAATVTASFEPADTSGLTLVASPEAGGMPVDVTDEGPYSPGTVVIIQAQPNPGYLFLSWTAPAGVLGDASNPTTTFTMPAESVEVTAHYEAIPYSLTVVANPAAMGNATDVTAASPYIVGEVVYIRAQANEGYGFVNWTSDPEGIIDNAEDPETFLTMPAGNATVTANFQLRPTVPTVTTEAATGITTYSAMLNMTYTTGNLTAIDIRFSVKRATDVTWFNDTWVSRAEDGTYAYGLTDLPASTEYEFKAQLRYDDTVIDGDVRRFNTASQPNILFPPFCFIATAAYGTPSAEQIDVLREFRDVVLAQSIAGSRFVTLYYQFSPPVAEVISESALLRTLTRELLVDPVVWIVDATGHLWRK